MNNDKSMNILMALLGVIESINLNNSTILSEISLFFQ